MHYKHTQISYFMILIMLAFIAFFTWIYITASQEPTTIDSGTNMLVTGIMTLTLLIIASFTTLQVNIDEIFLRIKFGFGIFQKKFLLSEIKSAKSVKNHWYYGWGIRIWFWPKMIIYNISGFDAVEIILKNGKRYRIGTDEPKILKQTILDSIQG